MQLVNDETGPLVDVERVRILIHCCFHAEPFAVGCGHLHVAKYDSTSDVLPARCP
jgi:hypothetical protein